MPEGRGRGSGRTGGLIARGTVAARRAGPRAREVDDERRGARREESDGADAARIVVCAREERETVAGARLAFGFKIFEKSINARRTVSSAAVRWR